MKESSEWVRQEMVDQTADEIAAERECTPAEVKPYWVAKRLQSECNGALCAKVYDWRRRREAEQANNTIEVPPEAEAEFRTLLDRLTAEMMAGFTRMVRGVGSDLDRVAALRIADAERRRDQAEADRDELLALWQRTEEDVANGHRQVLELKKALNETRVREQRLIGRIEQREMDMHAARPATQKAATPGAPAPHRVCNDGAPPRATLDQHVTKPESASAAQAEMPLPGAGASDDADGRG